VEVSENDILRVSVGDTAEIEVDAYLDVKFKGVVTEMASSAANSGAAQALTSDQVTNFIVKIRILPDSYLGITDKKMPFRPGMSATVDINTNTEKDVISIPIQAVTTREKKKDEMKKDSTEDKSASADKASKEDEIEEVVFVYEADTARMVKVVTGIQDNEFIQILSGLQPDQEIIIGPYSTVSRKLENGLALQRKEKNDDKDKDKKPGEKD